MPKLNPVDVLARVSVRLEQLQSGQSIETRTLNKLLTGAQVAQMEGALAQRKGSGKSVREIQIEVLAQIKNDLVANFDDAMLAYKEEQEVRAARVYLDAYFKAVDEDKNPDAMANAALQQNGFPRIDGRVASLGPSSRDVEVEVMEADLRRKIEAQMTPQEREDLRQSREYEEQRKQAWKNQPLRK